MSNPKISVIIINRNNEKYVGQAISSVLQNDDAQILVIDDFSTDNSIDIIKSYSVPYITLPSNVKQAETRNIGIKKSNADWFMFLDSDDYFLPDKISFFKKYLGSIDESVGLVYHDYFKEIDGVRARMFCPSFDRVLLEKYNYIFSSCIVRATALKTCGLFDPDFVPFEDYELWLRITEKYMAYHIPETLGVYRWHSTNTTKITPKEQMENVMRKIKEKHASFNRML